MQRRKNLIAALACGLACVAAILLYAQELRASAEAERAEVLARYGGEQVEVYAATEDIAAGEAVDETNTERRLWVGELLPPDAVSDLGEVRGKVLASPIYGGEAVSMRRFSQGDAAALQVPEGLCAVSVPAKPVSAVGGSVKAGAYVDVYATYGTSADRLAASVLVLSTSASASEGEGGDAEVSWVTLAVAPDLVEELIAAAQKAELYFALPSDGGIAAQAAGKAVPADAERGGGGSDEAGRDAGEEPDGTVRGEDGLPDEGRRAGESADGAQAGAADDEDAAAPDAGDEGEEPS